MKILFFTAITLFAGVGIAQAQQPLNCRGLQRPSCARGNQPTCMDMRGAYEIGGQPVPGWHCPEWPMPAGLAGGNNQNNNSGSNNTNQNNQGGARPCGRLDTLLTSWGVGAATTPPAGRPTIPTPPPTRAQSFMQRILGLAAGIVAGDNVQCSYLPKNDDGKKLYACTQTAEADGTYQRYLTEEIRINTASGIPRNEISEKSARDARSRILKECEGRLGIDRQTLQPTEKVCP